MLEANSGLGRVLFILVVLALGLVLAQRLLFSFMAQRPADYAETGPAFDLEVHLSGPLVADGVIYGPTGRMATRFAADIEGSWTGAEGTLTESFRYASGETQERVWRFTAAGPEGQFSGRADDVVGAAEGIVSGATVTLRYRLRLPPDAGGWEVDVTDWLYLGEDGAIQNRAQFRRFGILVGELVGSIRPAGE